MLRRLLPLMALAALLVGAALPRAEAQSPTPPTQTTPARGAIVIDLTSGAVLLNKNADTPIPPASMSKLMTLDLVFEALESGRLSMNDSFRTSAHAASMGGSKMFIREGEQVKVKDLLQGVVVQSGNDAAVALAEGVSGTEEAFARLMNQRAKAIGLTHSHFANATGWPDPGQRMSPRDLATLATRIIRKFPDHYKLFSEKEFTWDNITQQNRNPLLFSNIGADGLKTGHTQEAGYGLVGSAVRDGRRVLIVVTGLDSTQQRAQEGERLINWAFRAFDTKTLYKQGDKVADARVWIGADRSVALTPQHDVVVTVPYGMMNKAKVKAIYSDPVPAPIKAGDVLGHLEVTVPGVEPVSVPLVAARAVAHGGITSRLEAAGRLLLHRMLGFVG